MSYTDINKKLYWLGKLISSPEKTWEDLNDNAFDSKDILKRFFYPAVLIFGLAEMLGMILDTDNGIASYPFIIAYSFVIMFGILASFHLSFFSIKFLLISFDYRIKKNLIIQLLALPLSLVYFPIALTAIFRSMFFINIIIIYFIFIFWKGTQKIKNLPADRIQIFGILSTIFTIAIHLLMFLFIISLHKPLLIWL